MPIILEYESVDIKDPFLFRICGCVEMCYINMRKSIDLELRLSGIVMCEWSYWLIRQDDIMPVVLRT